MIEHSIKKSFPRNQLRKNILSTVCYFDAIEKSLTALEIWRFCLDTQYLFGENSHRLEPGNVSYSEILRVLDDLVRENFLVFSEGFYIISSKKEEHEIRKKNKKISDEKLWKLHSWASFLRYIPFIRSIIVTGGLSSGNATKNSDWDVLIVVRRGHIWTARFLMVFVTQLLGKRRYAHYIKDRICLNHFISDGALSLQLRDLFSAKEYILSLPLCNERLFERFLRENLWIRSFFPLWEIPRAKNMICLEKNSLGKILQRFLEAIPFWGILEKKLRVWQKQKILKNPKTNELGSYIVANDDALIFLPDPHGPRIFEKFKENTFRFSSRTEI